jgi:hypothetical protein
MPWLIESSKDAKDSVWISAPGFHFDPFFLRPGLSNRVANSA